MRSGTRTVKLSCKADGYSSPVRDDVRRNTGIVRSRRGTSAFRYDSDWFRCEVRVGGLVGVRISGVDLTEVPGISAITAHTILIEVGPDLSRFRNGSAFASRLGRCPDNKVSGGKVLYTGSRKVKNRAAIALRLGAQCLYLPSQELSRGVLPQDETEARRTASFNRHGTQTDPCRFLTKEPYNENVLLKWNEKASMRAEFRLRSQAAKLGFGLTPTTERQP